MILLAAFALAEPTRVAAEMPVGSAVEDLAVSPSGGWVAALDGGGTAWLLDTATWIPTSVATGCTTARGLGVFEDGETTVFVTGCDDGTIVRIDAESDGTVSSAQDVGSIGSPVHAVETDGENVYAVADDDQEVAAIALDGGSVVSGYPTAVGRSGVADTTISETTFFAVWGSDDVTEVTLSGGAAATSTEALGGRAFVDMWAVSSNKIFLADDSGGLLTYSPSSSDLQIDLDSYGTVTAVGGNTTDGYLAVAADDDVILYALSGDTRGDELGTIESVGEVGEIVTVEGYAFAAGGTDVQVWTDRPWVLVTAVSPDVAEAGDEVAVEFYADVDGSWVVETDEDELAEGEVTAGVATTASFPADGFDEGRNRVWVYVTADGRTGRAAADVVVDNPPPAVSGMTLGVGDERLHLTISEVDVADLAHYAVYLTTTEFDPDDYETGGPDFDGQDDWSNPEEVAAVGGAAVDASLTNLTNGTRYYVAVRGIDEGGKEGPMSEVLSATPEETYSAAELAGDPGGFCGLPLGAGWLAVLGAAVAIRRRVATVVALGVLAPGVAAAAPDDDDLTPRNWNVGVRYGPWFMQDEYLGTAFGEDGNQMFRLDYGWASQFVEVELGLGLYRRDGFLLTQDGAVSSDPDTFMIVPVGLDVVGRLDFFKEQPLVPFARIGGDYWIWQEAWDVGSADDVDTREGGKYGWHYGFGAMLLLDWLDRGVASELEANTGINDTYLVGEWRSSQIVSTGLEFSSTEVTFGLQFDF